MRSTNGLIERPQSTVACLQVFAKTRVRLSANVLDPIFLALPGGLLHCLKHSALLIVYTSSYLGDNRPWSNPRMTFCRALWC
jgi:hypothetical protein